MSNRSLVIGDAVRVYTDDVNIYGIRNARKAIGFVRFLGYIPSLKSDTLHSFTQYVGVELLQKIDKGHDGMIKGTQYFNVEKGYGIHVPIVNIIEVLSVSSLMSELKNVLSQLHKRDNYIKDLEAQTQYGPYHGPLPVLAAIAPIDVALPPSERNTFILPGPITPFTPRISKTNTSMHRARQTPVSASARSSCSMPVLAPNMQPFNGYLETKLQEIHDTHSRSNSYTYSTTISTRSPFTPPAPSPQPMCPNPRTNKTKRIKRLADLKKKPVPEVHNNAFENDASHFSRMTAID